MIFDQKVRDRTRILSMFPGQPTPEWVPVADSIRELAQKIGALKKGDQVITAGGLGGKVTKVDDTYAEIELAQGVRVKAVKSTIGDIIPPGGTAAND